MERLPSPGLFWLPGRETDKLFGQLEGEQGAIRLSLIGRLEDIEAKTISVTTTYFEDLEKVERVYGIIRGQLVTLQGLSKLRMGVSMPGFEESRYRPAFIIFGAHLPENLENMPIGISVRYSHLLYWQGTRGLIDTYEIKESNFAGVKWTYSYPPVLKWSLEGLNVSLEGGLDPKREWDLLTAQEFGYFNVRSATTMSIEQWYEDVIDPLHEMVKFAIFEAVTIDRVKLLFPDGAGNETTNFLDHYTAELVVNRKQKRDLSGKVDKQPSVLFRPSELSIESLASFLKTDMQTYRVRARFIACEQTEMKQDEFFLAYVRLLESLHRLLHPVPEEQINAYNARLEKIGDALNERDKELVTGRMKHGYEPSLEARLHQLAKPWKPRLQKEIAGGGEALSAEIQSINRHRNFLAHELPEELRPLEGTRLKRASWFLMILSRLAALEDAKFTVDAAWAAVIDTELFGYWRSQ